jgi:hypothetical protein
MHEHPLEPADLNVIESHRVFLGHSARGEFVERKDVAIGCCGLPIEMQNIGFLKPPYADVARTAEAVGAYFRARDLPYRIVHTARAPAACAEALRRLGFTEFERRLPVMTIATPRSVPDPPAGLRIERVRDGGQLAAFGATAFESFGFPVAGAPLFLHERVMALPSVRAFIGSADGATMACALSLASGGVNGIYWVGTLAAARKRGFGEALTWAAVAAAHESGAPLTVLQASVLGQPIYARMGFAHTHDYAYWIPPAA